MDQGLVDEHQPRGGSESDNSDYKPSAEDKKTIKMVEKLFEKYKKYRQLYDTKWLDYYHMFRGKQWKEQRPSYRHTEVVNLIFRTIQSMVPIQVDARPRFEFLPEEPGDMELAAILNEAAEADWQKKNWGAQLLEAVYDSNIYGTGHSSMQFNPKLNFNRGDIEFKSEDIFYIFPDPDARDPNQDCPGYITAVPTAVGKIKKKYPKVADFIKPDLIDIMKGSKTDLGQMKFRSPVDPKIVMEGSSSMDLVDKDRSLLITCYLSPEHCEDDYDEHEKIMRDPVSGAETKEYEQTAKYPNGRKIVICNGVLCQDGPNDYDDGEVPYERYPNYILPREYWGMSEVEQLEGPQKTFNKLVSFALDVLTLMGNPIWMIPSTSGVDEENLTNRPGLNVVYDGDRPPTREQGVQLQPYVLQLADKMAEWFDSIGGSQDVTRGVQPTGVTAASAISTLQEAAQTRVRQKARNLDYFLQDIGRHWLSRTMQFRTVPELYRLTNNEGVQKYFKMHVEKFDRTTDQVDPMTGETVQVPTGEQGHKVTVQPYTEGGVDPTQVKTFEMRGKMDVRVTTGSSLPFAKAEKEAKLLNLFDRGVIDDEELLKGSEYPNWQSVLARVQKKKMEAAQAEAQAAAAGAPPQAAAV